MPPEQQLTVKNVIISIAVLSVLIGGGYFGYRYYFKKQIEEPPVSGESSREEIMKQFITPSPDTNKIELTEEQKKFTKLISESLVPTKTDPERERLIKEFTSPQ